MAGGPTWEGKAGTHGLSVWPHQYLSGRPACRHAPEERQQTGYLQLRSQNKRPWAGTAGKRACPCRGPVAAFS